MSWVYTGGASRGAAGVGVETCIGAGGAERAGHTDTGDANKVTGERGIGSSIVVASAVGSVVLTGGACNGGESAGAETSEMLVYGTGVGVYKGGAVRVTAGVDTEAWLRVAGAEGALAYTDGMAKGPP